MVFAVAFSASAQNNDKPVDYGIRAGVGLASLSGDQVSGAGTRTSFNGGFFAEMNISDYAAFQPELNLVFRGAKDNFTFETNQYTETTQTDLQIPLLFKFKLPTDAGIVPYINIGPAFNLNLNNSFTAPEGAANKFQEPNAKKTYVSAIGGAGIRFQNIFIDARYDLGVTNAYDWTQTRSNVLAISLGYYF